MPCIAYKATKFRPDTLAIIEMAVEIVDEYQSQGFNLTLRQVFYQFVSRDLIPNTERSYKRLGSIINDARLAGLLDWQSIEDRTRDPKSTTHWNSPAEIVEASVRSYKIDKWENQRHHVEVWVEKDALIDVVKRACKPLDVTRFSCRGYVSQSAMWRAGRRLTEKESDGHDTVILHLGDHDPSGIDMTRDIKDRLAMFGSSVLVRRIALTMDQIDELGPPPNPAKLSDSRARDYIAQYGDESWELDALEPAYMVDLITDHVLALRDEDDWDEAVEREDLERGKLKDAARTLRL